LCVALTGEGQHLRDAGICAPILVMSEQQPEQLDDLVRYGLIATVYNEGAIEALSRAAARANVVCAVHLKIDTGMHRVGASPDRGVALASSIADDPWLEFDGMYTHLARADDQTGDGDTRRQLDVFAEVVSHVTAQSMRPRRIHIANSAATLRNLASNGAMTMHRVGIATYGIPANPLEGDAPWTLEPVMSLKARVSHVQVVPAGEAVSYGLRRPLDVTSTVATLPLGYADGVPRRLWERGEVLIGGKRRPFAGVVTMDQVMVVCGTDAVRVPEWRGGRDPTQVFVRTPAALVDLEQRSTAVLEERRWRGALPSPSPTRVYDTPVAVEVMGHEGFRVVVSGRHELNVIPTQVIIDRVAHNIVWWAGPWPVEECWWDHHRKWRAARMHVVTEQRAMVLVLEHGVWLIVAEFG
jgi:alanine racemase